jgi:transposase
MGRPIAKLEISAAERRELLAQLAVRKALEDEKFRIRIVLACEDGLAGEAIAKKYRILEHTVSKWRRRYAAYRFAGLTGAPRPGRPRSVSDKRVQAVIERTRNAKPKAARQWSVRTMSQASGLGDVGGSHLGLRRDLDCRKP